MLRNSRLSVHLVFWYTVLFVIIATTLVLLVNWQMRQQALTEAERQASLLLDRNLATHTYFTHELKPNIFKWTESFRSPDYFDPSWMSSTYAVRQMDKIFHQLAKEPYYYKESSINARSPEAEADDYEKGFLQELQKDSNLMRKTDIRYFDGQPYLTVLRRGEPMESSCMRCHTTPDLAPKGMVDIYGPDRSFGRNLDEVVQAISIRIPLASAYAGANKFSLHLSLLLLTLLLGGFGLLFVFTKRKIITPIEQISNKAILIANSSEHLGETILEPQSSELKNLAQAFNMMSISLKKSMNEIEDRVAERTAELRTKNVLLAKEIGERKRAEDALRREQVFTITLLENLLEGIVACDADGTLVLFNKMSRDWHGLDAIAIPQEQWANYFDLYCADGVTPMTEETVPLSRAFRGEKLRNEDMVIRAKGQPDRHIVANCAPFFDENGSKLGAVGVMRDITDRKRAEELLHTTIQRYHKILSSMYAGLLLVSEDGYVEYVNQAFCDLFNLDDPPVNLQGLSAPDMIQKIQDFYADPAYAVNRIQTIVTQGLPIMGEEIALADARICMVDYVPILIEGKSGGRLWLHYDITDRKRMEKEKESLIIELQKSLSEIKKLSGFLPICASCKKIRNDEGYWKEVETYIGEHSEAQFSHGICPDCIRKLYPEIADEMLGPLEKDEKK